jgi:hypothetical protein
LALLISRRHHRPSPAISRALRREVSHDFFLRVNVSLRQALCLLGMADERLHAAALLPLARNLELMLGHRTTGTLVLWILTLLI